ncbi:MAG: hypothetical protein ACI8PZ_006719 [Myxococcota bacterium]
MKDPDPGQRVGPLAVPEPIVVDAVAPLVIGATFVEVEPNDIPTDI